MTEIPITYVRSSMCGAYQMCPRGMFAEYFLGWKGPSNKKADKGTIVHKVLELLGQTKLAEQNGDCGYADEQTGITLTDIPTNEELDALIDGVYNYYQNRLKHHDWVPQDRLDCHTWVWKAIELNEGIFDPRNLNIVCPEKSFSIPLNKSWSKYCYYIDDKAHSGDIYLRGTIDLIYQIDKNTLHVVDWKTGERKNWATGQRKTYDDLTHDPQLLIYYYAASILYPSYENILLSIFYIRDGGPITLAFDKDDLKKAERVIRKLVTSVQNGWINMKKSWKCNRFCHLGKTTFEGTDIQPIPSENGFLTKCEQIDKSIKDKGIQLTIDTMSESSFDRNQYYDPGGA